MAEELWDYKQKVSIENELTNGWYHRAIWIIKDLHQAYSKAVFAGTQSGNGMLGCDNYEKSILMGWIR